MDKIKKKNYFMFLYLVTLIAMERRFCLRFSSRDSFCSSIARPFQPNFNKFIF